MEIQEKIIKFIKKYTKNEISEDEIIFEAGFVNSLFAMQLVLFIERTFNISVDNDVIGTDEFCSISTICGYIESNM